MIRKVIENREVKQSENLTKQSDSPALFLLCCQNRNYIFIVNLTAHLNDFVLKLAKCIIMLSLY